MKYLVEVTIALKEGIFDPQGDRVKRTLFEMGHEKVDRVDIGKSIILSLRAQDDKKALEEGDKIAQELLINPVLETYTISLVGKEDEVS